MWPRMGMNFHFWGKHHGSYLKYKYKPYQVGTYVYMYGIYHITAMWMTKCKSASLFLISQNKHETSKFIFN